MNIYWVIRTCEESGKHNINMFNNKDKHGMT